MLNIFLNLLLILSTTSVLASEPLPVPEVSEVAKPCVDIVGSVDSKNACGRASYDQVQFANKNCRNILDCGECCTIVIHLECAITQIMNGICSSCPVSSLSPAKKYYEDVINYHANGGRKCASKTDNLQLCK